MRPEQVVVVVPTYNERGNLPSLVPQILTQGYRLLVVDDDSPDGTGELAESLAGSEPLLAVLRRPLKEGIGPAYVAGFDWAIHEKAEAVVEMDADFSHDPADLPRLVGALDRADLAIGSRYVPGGGTPDWKLRRRLLSRGGNWYARKMLGINIRDSTGGFRAYRTEALAGLEYRTTQASGYGFQVEMAWRAVRAALRIEEVPIIFRDRKVGASKMGFPIVVEAMVLVTRWGLRRKLPWLR